MITAKYVDTVSGNTLITEPVNISVSSAPLSSVSITTPEATRHSMVVGVPMQLSAQGVWENGITYDVTSMGEWSITSGSDKVTVNDKGVATAVKPGDATVEYTFEGKRATATLKISDASVSYLTLSPVNSVVSIGGSQVLEVTAHFSNGTSQELPTSLFSLVSGDVKVATVVDGEVTGVSVGETSITATLKSDTSKQVVGKVVVTDKKVSSIVVSLTDSSIAVGANTTAKATVTYDDGTSEDMTSRVGWLSSNHDVAMVTGGMIRGLSEGTTQIKAIYGGLESDDVALAVTAKTVTDIQVTPAVLELAVGRDANLRVIAKYSDDSTGDVAGSHVTWKVSKAGVVSIHEGEVRAEGEGEVTITAEYEGKSATSNIKVTKKTLENIALVFKDSGNLTPLVGEVAEGFSIELGVVGSYSDGSSERLSPVTYDISGSSVTHSGDTFTAESQGLSVITAKYVDTVSGNTLITEPVNISVSSAPLSSVSITTPEATRHSMVVGVPMQLSAQGVWENGITYDVTSMGEWSITSGSDKVTVNDKGVATAVKPGDATVEYTFEGKRATATLKISDASVSYLTLSPVNSVVSIGGSQVLEVTAHFSNGTSQELPTSLFSLVSGDVKVATVVDGEVTGVSVGETSITATLKSDTSKQVVGKVVVTDKKVSSIVVSLTDSSIAVGANTTAKATVTYDDGTSEDMTSRVGWLSSNHDVAMVTGGMIRGLSEGTTQIKAIYGGLESDDVALAVTAKTVTDIQVTPAVLELAVGRDANLRVIAKYSDDSTGDVAGSHVTWKVSKAGVVSIHEGEVRAEGEGEVTITAEYEGKSATSNIKVTKKTLENIALVFKDSGNLTPLVGEVAEGFSIELGVVGSYSDGSSERLSPVTYDISGSSVTHSGDTFTAES
ncbi:Ig-like domain-containing protein, partial [Vibrio parahaemolyticus]